MQIPLLPMRKSNFYSNSQSVIFSSTKKQDTTGTRPFPFLRGTFFKRTHNRFSQMAASFSPMLSLTNQAQSDTVISRRIVLKNKKIHHSYTHQAVLTQLAITSRVAYEPQYYGLLTWDQVCDSTPFFSHRQKKRQYQFLVAYVNQNLLARWLIIKISLHY